MNNGVVPNRYVVTNICRVFLIGSVNYRSVLDINLISHFYIVYIASNNGIKPDATIVSHSNIPNNGSIFSNIASVWNLRGLSVYGFYYRHDKLGLNIMVDKIKKLYLFIVENAER